MADQLSGRALSVHGNGYVSTPNIDSLIGQGVGFRESYCVAPICTPSRHGLLTSLIPEQTQVKYNSEDSRRTSRRPILNAGEILREAGYKTAWAGKWHIGRYYPVGGVVPGFDYLDTGVKGEVGSKVDDPVAEAAIEFLRQTHEAPFFLGVSFQNPHDICFWVRGEDLPIPEVSPDRHPPLPDNFLPDPEEPEFIVRCRERRYYGHEVLLTRPWDNTKWREYLHAYYSLVERVDGAIGRVLTGLRDHGLEQNTLVVFTSDHGEGLAAHKWAAKLMFYEDRSESAGARAGQKPAARYRRAETRRSGLRSGRDTSRASEARIPGADAEVASV
jgi:arylsulfatase A-like enzyme